MGAGPCERVQPLRPPSQEWFGILLQPHDGTAFNEVWQPGIDKAGSGIGGERKAFRVQSHERMLNRQICQVKVQNQIEICRAARLANQANVFVGRVAGIAADREVAESQKATLRNRFGRLATI